ncbi:MAG: hypothetical protein AMK73_03315 [Planctomycetes bacterium SM23_32]|nr:MAG: hypothetical protein AMK73_03315 [Planctomycetes bacterium SM23_32]
MATDVERRESVMTGIYHTVDRSRANWRILDALEGLLRTFVTLGAALLVGLAADNVLHLPGALRAAYGIGLLAGLAFMLGRLVLYPLVRPISDEMAAAHVERAFPHLDNRLINAVQLADERFADRLTRRMALSQIRQTAEQVGGRRLPFSAGLRRLWPAARRAAVVVGVLVVYALLFNAHFGNACQRMLHPYRYIPPITNTRLSVTPGDTVLLQGDGLLVEARVGGLLPETARIRVETADGEKATDAMAFEGSAFTYEFANVQRDFTYRLSAGDALTRPYRVTVRSRPTVRRLELTYSYPTYTGLPDRTEQESAGDVRAPVGTTVRFAVTPDRPMATGRLELRYEAEPGGDQPAPVSVPLKADGATLHGELELSRSGRYAIHLADEAGVRNVPQVRRLEAVPDAAPRVFFVQPARDVAVAPDARVALLAGAEDDFSLRELHLFLQRRAGAESERYLSWTYEPGTQNAREGAVLDVQELGLKLGDALAYYMQANDKLRREGEQESVGRSRLYHVRVVDAEQAASGEAGAREALRDVVTKLIEMQKANLAGTGLLADESAAQEELAAEDEDAWTGFRNRAGQLVNAEEDIYARAAEAVGAYAGQDSASMTEALGRIAAGEVSRAVGLLKDLQGAPDSESIPPRAQEAAQREARVLALLQALLEDPARLLAQILEEEEGSEELSEQLEDLVGGEQLAKRLLKNLEGFAEEQARVIEMSNRLAAKPAEDFTGQDERDLEEIVDTEKEWTRFFQEAATDLSKLPPQDMSLATQAQELLEVYSEVQQAVAEAERKAVEMAVPHEQAAVELAESIETNIEKWLMETKDDQLWSMEDPLEDYEVPITELPGELQDLIGDLVEGEEDMQEQYDDVTSAWFDSLDVGAGWDTMDGPISNMSAKGVTGNRLPNTQEVGGRSGEGRTGRSSGQFVEEEATGKGGRQTPSRLTADPFEAGWVKDTSGEAPTGATGGGKVSGQGAEGFQGPSPPPLQQKLNRMAIQQGEILDNARRLEYGLKKYRHPRGKLPEAIELMEAQKTALEAGDVSLFGRQQRVVLSNLRELKELSEKQKQLLRDRTALLPKQLREEIASGQGERVPEQYRQMVENYFRALSEE